VILSHAAHIYLHMPVMIALISLVYSATRYEQWGNILIEAFRWGLRMAVFLCGIGVALYLLSFFV
jgi:hypothetical protein